MLRELVRDGVTGVALAEPRGVEVRL